MGIKKRDIVEYIGCSVEQIRWGNNDDPRSILIVGHDYVVEDVDVHSQHTKIKLCHKIGWFNSVCFKIKNKQVNSNLRHSKMNPSDITLETHSKMFEYERISREVEECDDIEYLKNMCRCYVKLHMKQQEVFSNMTKNL